MSLTPDVLVYDATLRLGSAGTGFRPGLGDAIAVLGHLEELGVAYAEVGAPGDNPRDATLLARIARERPAAGLRLAAHVTLPLTDASWRALLAADTPVVALSVPVSAPQVTRVLGLDPAAVPGQVAAAVARLSAEGREVILDAEHALDGWGADATFARAVLDAAAGVSVITLCDTLGGALPWQFAEPVAAAGAYAPRVGVQCHDDGGCATANTLAAVQAGAGLVQVTVNGYGNRCGAADLVPVVAGVELKLGRRALPPGRLGHLQRVAHAVAELANLVPDQRQPYVGGQAFAHGGGAGAVTSAPELAQHIDPTLVGNAMTLRVSGLAGVAGVALRARELGVDVPPDMAGRVADVVRSREMSGFSYEAAEASFELLLRGEVDGLPARVFDLESWRVIVERRADGQLVSEATVKLYVDGHRVVATGEGNGPVNALDTAIRTALGDSHPALAALELVDYKVRILDGGHGTGAVTRVLITTTDGEREWVTVGAGENLIDASWQALEDAVSYGLAMPGVRAD